MANFSQIAIPLTDLTKKSAPDKVKWTKECQEAFDSLKEALQKEPVLIAPQYDQPLVVQTDASNRAVGGVLAQYVDGQLKPIAFVSRKFLPREINYSTIEKETLAIIFIVQTLRSYLIGQHFQLQTDHSPLECLFRLSSNCCYPPFLSQYHISKVN